MRKKTTVVGFAGLLIGLLLLGGPPVLSAAEIFVTIGGGDRSGVYYPSGLAIARMLNAKRHDYGIRATVEATDGATFNMNAILAGYMDFGGYGGEARTPNIESISIKCAFRSAVIASPSRHKASSHPINTSSAARIRKAALRCSSARW